MLFFSAFDCIPQNHSSKSGIRFRPFHAGGFFWRRLRAGLFVIKLSCVRNKLGA